MNPTPATIDVNVWIGRWPFALRPEMTAHALARRLRRAGIDAAWVSPLDALLAPDPQPANAALLRDTRRQPALRPLPVVNPRLLDWPGQLEQLAADPRVRAVRIAPGFHGYRLDGAAAHAVADAVAARGWRLAITARHEDERQQHWAWRVRGVPVKALDRFLARRAPEPVLCTGLYRQELKPLARHRHLRADLSLAEWMDTLCDLLGDLQPGQLMLGTLTPYLEPEAGLAKVTAAAVPAAVRRAVAGGNARAFFGP